MTRLEFSTVFLNSVVLRCSCRNRVKIGETAAGTPRPRER